MAQDITNVSVTKDAYECTITVDCAVFGFQEGVLKLLLIQKLAEPFKGFWLLPGGIMQEGKTTEEAVKSVLLNLTGLKNIHQEQVYCYSDVNRHPLKRVITISYYGLINPENHPIIKQKHVSGVEWFRLDELPELGFDHEQLIKDALNLLKSNVEERLILGELLPARFTLTELQDLFEALLDKKLDRRNFRKKVLQKGLLANTGEKKVGAKGGPDLYTFLNK
ncbi:MAG: NUDIX domain-containing protein [Bacteroidota bacterium]